MHFKISKGRVVSAIVFAALFLGVAIFALQFMNNRNAYEEALFLDEDWKLTINAQVKEHVNLEQEVFSPVGIGDVLSIESVIPEHEFAAPMLRFWMCHSAFRIYVDETCVYSYGFEALEAGKMVGTGYHWISLPDDCGGKSIRIDVFAGEKDALTNFDRIILSEAEDAVPDFISDTFLNICAGIFLVVMGLCLMVVTVCMECFASGFSQILYTGIFSILIGMWSLCNKGDIQLISANRVLNQLVEHGSLYLGMIPILLFVHGIRDKVENPTRLSKLNDKMPAILISVNVVMYVLAIILHNLNIIHFTMVITAFHIFMIVGAVYVLTSCIQRSKNGDTQEVMILIGMIILATCFLVDVLIFHIAKYYNGSISKYMGVSAWGCIAFSLCMLGSYGVYVYRGLCSRVEKEALTNMAYTDYLTGLSNAAKYKETLNHYEEENSSFTAITFDLNGLKYVNDNYGHEEGNRLLRGFAEVIHKAFHEEGLVARIGGDEFMVILPWENEVRSQALLDDYKQILAKANENASKYPLEAAYGMAARSETHEEYANAVVRMADERMYARKKEMKKTSTLPIR